MEQINEELLEFLILELDQGEKKLQAIILKLEQAIKIGFFLPGSTFPTQKWVGEFYNVGEKITIAVWKELKERGLIETRTSMGTIVADIIYPDVNFQKEYVPDPNHPRLVMDQLPVVDKYGYKRNFSTKLNKAKAVYSLLNYDERRLGVNLDFARRVKNVINYRLKSSFSIQEVHYSQDSHLQIFALVQTYLSDSVFVVAKPVSDTVTSAVHKAGKEMVTVGSDRMGIDTGDLERICKERKVGIVCISSRAPFPSDCIISDKKMDHLLVLQQVYGFLIFFNDTYPVPDASHARIYKEMSINTNMVYLGPLSLLDANLYGITILVAKEAKMKKIAKKFISIGRLAEPKLIYAITYLLKKGQILNYEKKDYKSITLIYNAAVQVLRESGLWKEEGLYSAVGWICYLEPKVGILPPNAFELLANKNIFVFDPQRFDGGAEFTKGISISLGTMKTEKQVIEDIEKINSILYKDYKRNTHQ